MFLSVLRSEMYALQCRELPAAPFRLWIYYHKNRELSILLHCSFFYECWRNEIFAPRCKYNLTKQITCGIIYQNLRFSERSMSKCSNLNPTGTEKNSPYMTMSFQ